MFHFESFEAAADIRTHAERYLQCEFAAEDPTVMATSPSGRPVLVFSLDGAPEAAVGAAPLARQPLATVRGQCTAPVHQRFLPGQRYFMVVLRPTGLRSLLGLPARALTDSQVDARTTGAASAAALVELFDQLRAARDFEARCRLTETILRRVVAAQAQDTPGVVAQAVHCIDSTTGRVGVGELADRLAVSPRTLRRQFLDTVGLAPKTFAAVTRFRSVVADLHRDEDSVWLDLVHRYGYADQSHFGREFRRFAGLCPSAYRPGRAFLDRELNATP